jgi:hypothetical protein
MGSLVGGITDAVGLTNNKGEERAAQNASEANERAFALNKEHVELMKDELEFQKDQYNEWKDIYGDLQDNLGEYYNDLDADDLTVRGLEAQQTEYQQAVKSIERDAAAKGLVNSGVEFGTKAAMTMSNATERARIRADSPQQAAQQKMSFLGLGLGQGTQMLGTITQAGSNAGNAFQSGVNSQTQMNGNYLSQQTSFGIANMDAMGDLAGYAMGAPA